MKLPTSARIGILLVLVGLVRLPVERSVEHELEAAHFRDGLQFTQSMRDQLGQLGFAATLGGFRSFLATMFELRSVSQWSQVDWDGLESSFNMMTQLQPREASYWSTAAWHLDKNAVSHYLHFDTRPEGERLRDAQTKSERARLFLMDGLKFNPENRFLLSDYANFLAKRDGDHCQAADYFRKAYEAGQGRYPLALRFSAYELARCPGREQEAYTLLRRFYDEDMKLPSVIKGLKDMEQALDIPLAKRIPEPYPEVYQKKSGSGRRS